MSQVIEAGHGDVIRREQGQPNRGQQAKLLGRPCSTHCSRYNNPAPSAETPSVGPEVRPGRLFSNTVRRHGLVEITCRSYHCVGASSLGALARGMRIYLFQKVIFSKAVVHFRSDLPKRLLHPSQRCMCGTKVGHTDRYLCYGLRANQRHQKKHRCFIMGRGFINSGKENQGCPSGEGGLPL